MRHSGSEDGYDRRDAVIEQRGGTIDRPGARALRRTPTKRGMGITGVRRRSRPPPMRRRPSRPSRRTIVSPAPKPTETSPQRPA
jgi:hypothetical protein